MNEIDAEIARLILNYEDGEIDSIDGSYFPEHILSPHQKLPIRSEAMAEVMATLLETLRVFHIYAEENNILYSLHAGSLLGYYRTGGMVPWDDDIDIKVSKESMLKLDELWESGTRPHFEGDKPWKGKLAPYGGHFPMYKARLIDFCGEKYELLKGGGKSCFREVPRLIKLRPASAGLLPARAGDRAGGLDISFCVPRSDQRKECNYSKLPLLGCSWIFTCPCVGPVDGDSWEDYPVVEFSGIKTRAAVRRLGEPVLNSQYGFKWKIPCHPAMNKASLSQNIIDCLNRQGQEVGLL